MRRQLSWWLSLSDSLAFQCIAWPLLDKGPKHINGRRKNGNVKYYPQIKWSGSTSMAFWLWASSTLVFLPYIKDIAVLQTQAATSLFTRQKAGDTAACGFSCFIMSGKQDLSLMRRRCALDARHHLALAGIQSCTALAGDTAQPPRVPAPGLTAPLGI